MVCVPAPAVKFVTTISSKESAKASRPPDKGPPMLGSVTRRSVEPVGAEVGGRFLR